MILTFSDFITEALKLSDAKKYTQIWLNSGMKDYLNEWFKGEYRIYIPLYADLSKLKLTDEDKKVKSRVELELKEIDYEIESFLGNLCKKIGTNKNFTKISKVLNSMVEKAESAFTKYEKENDTKYGNPYFSRVHNLKTLQSKYLNVLNDVGSSDTETNLIVISRHPIDIAGMSTGRNWESCMTIGSKGGFNSQYVEVDVKMGTIIAYLIKADDKNIEKPLSRILIKPYVDSEGKSWLFPDSVYGTPNRHFAKTIEKWLVKIQGRTPKGVYDLTGDIYNDKYKYKNKDDLYGDNLDRTLQIGLSSSEKTEIYLKKQYGFNVVKHIKQNLYDITANNWIGDKGFLVYNLMKLFNENKNLKINNLVIDGNAGFALQTFSNIENYKWLFKKLPNKIICKEFKFILESTPMLNITFDFLRYFNMEINCDTIYIEIKYANEVIDLSVLNSKLLKCKNIYTNDLSKIKNFDNLTIKELK